MNKKYDSKWNTPVGADCIDLHSTLARWLGERLIHLGEHTKGTPYAYWMKFSTGENTFDEDAAFAAWKADLTTNGKALLAYVEDVETLPEDVETLPAAQEAMRWVADNLGFLWD
jgi:hypothetical protein